MHFYCSRQLRTRASTMFLVDPNKKKSLGSEGELVEEFKKTREQMALVGLNQREGSCQSKDCPAILGFPSKQVTL